MLSCRRSCSSRANQGLGSKSKSRGNRAYLVLEKYCNGGWGRGVARCIRGDDLDCILAGLTVSGDGSTGTEANVIKRPIHVNIIADIRLRIEIVSGLGPLDLQLRGAVDAVGAQIRGHTRRSVIVRVRR